MEPNVSRYINFMLLLSPSYVSSLYSLDHIWSLFSDTRIFVANFYWLLGYRGYTLFQNYTTFEIVVRELSDNICSPFSPFYDTRIKTT